MPCEVINLHMLQGVHFAKVYFLNWTNYTYTQKRFVYSAYKFDSHYVINFSECTGQILTKLSHWYLVSQNRKLAIVISWKYPLKGSNKWREEKGTVTTFC